MWGLPNTAPPEPRQNDDEQQAVIGFYILFGFATHHTVDIYFVNTYIRQQIS